MQKEARRHTMYAKGWHIWLTISFIVLPFLFLFVFAGIGHISSRALLVDLGYSTYRMAIAYVIAALVAWVCAVSFYSGKRSTVALPVFDVLQSFPTFAALPAAVAIWGTTDTTVIIF